MRRRGQRISVTVLVIILAAVTFLSGRILCIESDGSTQRLYTPCRLDLKTGESSPDTARNDQVFGDPSCSRCFCVPFVMIVESPNQTRTDLAPDPAAGSGGASALVDGAGRSAARRHVNSRNQFSPSLLLERSVVLLI